MSNIEAKPEWADVPQIEVGDRVRGGKDGPANKQAQALANRTEIIKSAVLSYPDYAAAAAAAADLPDGQIVVSDSDEVKGVVSGGSISEEQSVYKVADYAKIRSYTGRGNRLRVVDLTGAHWWIRRGVAADNGGTVLKDAQGRSWEREYSGLTDARWFGAKADGITNDSASMNAATVAAHLSIDLGGGDVYAPGFSNSSGLRVIGGRLLGNSRIAGQKDVLNTYADDVNGIMVGRENLAAFMLNTSAAAGNTVYVYGDSTVEQNAMYARKSHDLIKLAAIESGLSYVDTVNRGVGGTSWSDLSATIDLGSSTKLIIIKYGINDATKPNALATMAADARSKLAAIRANTYGDFGNLSILLMGPSSTYAPTSNQDSKWYENLRGLYLQLCKEFDCAYFDTYAYLQSTRYAPGMWMDDFTAISRPGEGLHPTPEAAYWIWYEGFKKHVFGDGTWSIHKANHFWNRGASVPGITIYVTDLPRDYPFGITIDFVNAANGWPVTGLLMTYRSAASGVNGNVHQSLTTLDPIPRRMMRTGVVSTWTQWTGVAYSVSTFINGWENKGGGYGSAGWQVDEDGFVSLFGVITGGTIGISAFTLPSNARPGYARNFCVSASAGAYATGTVVVFGDGSVVPYAASNATISLDGIRFKA